MRQLSLPTTLAEDETEGGTGGSWLVNLYAVGAPERNSKSPVRLLPTPGLEKFKEFAGNSIAIDIRTISKKNYYFLSDGIYNEDGERLLEIALTRNAIIAQGLTSIVVVDNHQGAFVRNRKAGVIDFARAGQDAPHSVTWHDGYYIFANSKNVFISHQRNPSILSALEFQGAVGDPDDITCVYRHELYLWVFGSKTTEIWQNTGNLDFPYTRISNVLVNKGTLSPRSVADYNGIVYFLGDDKVVYRSNGFTPRKISNSAVDFQISQTSAERAFGFTYTERGRSFYSLTLENDKTFVYDINQDRWHEREFGSKTPIFSYTNIGDEHIVCNRNDGIFWKMSHNCYTYDDEPIQRMMQMPTLTLAGSQSRRRFTIPMLEFEGETDQQEEESESSFRLLSTMSQFLTVGNGDYVFVGGENTEMLKQLDTEVNMLISKDRGYSYNFRGAALDPELDGTLRTTYRRLGIFRDARIRFLIRSKRRLNIIGVHAQIQ